MKHETELPKSKVKILSIEKPNLAPSKNNFRNANKSIVLSEKVTRISHQNFLQHDPWREGGSS
jgi:hypothetical protein